MTHQVHGFALKAVLSLSALLGLLIFARVVATKAGPVNSNTALEPLAPNAPSASTPSAKEDRDYKPRIEIAEPPAKSELDGLIANAPRAVKVVRSTAGAEACPPILTHPHHSRQWTEVWFANWSGIQIRPEPGKPVTLFVPQNGTALFDRRGTLIVDNARTFKLEAEKNTPITLPPQDLRGPFFFISAEGAGDARAKVSFFRLEGK